MGASVSKRMKRRAKRKKQQVEEHGKTWNAWQTMYSAVNNPEVDLMDPEVLLKVMSTSFQTMSRGEGTYVCKLDDATLAKAKSELNEDPIQRAGQIEALRQWVKKQPHINSRTDDEFLLSFLRWSKFSQLRAQTILDNYWTARTTEKEWFDSMDPASPKLQEIMDLGQQFPLGKNDDGQMVIYIRTGGFDPDAVSVGELMTAGFMMLDILLGDEATQIHGVQVLLDFTDFRLAHAWAVDKAHVEKASRCLQVLSAGGYDPKQHSFADVMKVGFMTSEILLQEQANQVHGFQILLDFSEFGTEHMWVWDRATIQKCMRCWQDVYPTRNKGIHYYNTPTIFNALSEVFAFFMKEKTRKRVHFHKDSKESLASKVPKRILPNHLGGEAGTLEELAQKWKETMVKHREDFLYNAQFGVDESKRPKPEVKEESGGWGLVGSFRKLTTD